MSATLWNPSDSVRTRPCKCHKSRTYPDSGGLRLRFSRAMPRQFAAFLTAFVGIYTRICAESCGVSSFESLRNAEFDERGVLCQLAASSADWVFPWSLNDVCSSKEQFVYPILCNNPLPLRGSPHIRFHHVHVPKCGGRTYELMWRDVCPYARYTVKHYWTLQLREKMERDLHRVANRSDMICDAPRPNHYSVGYYVNRIVLPNIPNRENIGVEVVRPRGDQSATRKPISLASLSGALKRSKLDGWTSLLFTSLRDPVKQLLSMYYTSLHRRPFQSGLHLLKSCKALFDKSMRRAFETRPASGAMHIAEFLRMLRRNHPTPLSAEQEAKEVCLNSAVSLFSSFAVAPDSAESRQIDQIFRSLAAATAKNASTPSQFQPLADLHRSQCTNVTASGVLLCKLLSAHLRMQQESVTLARSQRVQQWFQGATVDGAPVSCASQRRNVGCQLAKALFTLRYMLHVVGMQDFMLPSMIQMMLASGIDDFAGKTVHSYFDAPWFGGQPERKPELSQLDTATTATLQDILLPDRILFVHAWSIFVEQWLRLQEAYGLSRIHSVKCFTATCPNFRRDEGGKWIVPPRQPHPFRQLCDLPCTVQNDALPAKEE